MNSFIKTSEICFSWRENERVHLLLSSTQAGDQEMNIFWNIQILEKYNSHLLTSIHAVNVQNILVTINKMPEKVIKLIQLRYNWYSVEVQLLEHLRYKDGNYDLMHSANTSLQVHTYYIYQIHRITFSF